MRWSTMLQRMGVMARIPDVRIESEGAREHRTLALTGVDTYSLPTINGT
jgi:hypothetical protein